MVRLRGRNDADERQQAKTTAEMRRQEQAKEVQAYEERRAQRALSDDVSGIPGHRDRQRASGYTEEQMRRDIIKGLELLKRQRERNRDAR